MFLFFVVQIRIIFALPLPSLVPLPLVPWAAAPVAYPSIHHWGYWTNVHQMFSRRNSFIDGVNATVCVAIRPPVVEWEGRLVEEKKLT